MSNTFATPWTVALQASRSIGFPGQEYWSGLPFPSPGDPLYSGIEPASSVLAGGFTGMHRDWVQGPCWQPSAQSGFWEVPSLLVTKVSWCCLSDQVEVEPLFGVWHVHLLSLKLKAHGKLRRRERQTLGYLICCLLERSLQDWAPGTGVTCSLTYPIKTFFLFGLTSLSRHPLYLPF